MKQEINQFKIDYQPLTVTYSLEVVQEVTEDSDGVPGRQTYDVMGGGYYPDYSVFPLVIQPRVFAYDPDEIIGRGLIDVTKDVANMKWYLIVGTEKTLLQGTSPDWQIIPDGDNKGRFKLKRNVDPQFPITLQYEADYLDPRKLEVHKIVMTYLVRCETHQLPCVLKLDVSSQLFYNPYKESTQIVHASIFSGNNVVQFNMCKCVWEVLANDGVNWLEAGSDIEAAFIEVSEDTMSVQINMEYMGDECTIRCYGIATDIPSELAQKTKEDAFDYCDFRISRKIPSFNVNMLRFPRTITKDQKAIYPKAQINFTNFETDNPLKEVDAVWSTRKVVGNNVIFSESDVVASGLEPEIATDKVTSSEAQAVRLSVRDRGAYKILTDGQGRAITDGQGRIIMVR